MQKEIAELKRQLSIQQVCTHNNKTETVLYFSTVQATPCPTCTSINNAPGNQPYPPSSALYAVHPSAHPPANSSLRTPSPELDISNILNNPDIQSLIDSITDDIESCTGMQCCILGPQCQCYHVSTGSSTYTVNREIFVVKIFSYGLLAYEN